MSRGHPAVSVKIGPAKVFVSKKLEDDFDKLGKESGGKGDKENIWEGGEFHGVK